MKKGAETAYPGSLYQRVPDIRRSGKTVGQLPGGFILCFCQRFNS